MCRFLLLLSCAACVKSLRRSSKRVRAEAESDVTLQSKAPNVSETEHGHQKRHGQHSLHSMKRWQELQAKVHERRQPGSIWGEIREDDRDDGNIHCGETGMAMSEKVAAGTWPINHPSVFSHTGKTVACENGQADAGSGGLYQCERVNLVSHVPLADFSSTNANDVWGWVDTVDPNSPREYAIIGLGEGTGFVDITVPTQPVVVAMMPTASTASTWRDIKVFNNMAYVVSEARGHGMQVFDLTRLRGRTSPATQADEADFVLEDFGSAHNIIINTETGRAYAVGARNKEGTERACNGGLVIMNIADPDPSKTHVEGCFSADGYTHDAQCVVYRGPDTAHAGKEICFAYNEDTVSIIDVSRAVGGVWREPTLISRTPYNGSYYTHQGWLDDNQAFAYVNDELDEKYSNDKHTKTYVFNVTDLEQPVLYSVYRHAVESIDHNNYVVGDYVYQGNYCAGLRILKIQPDHTVAEVAYFDTEPECDQAEFGGTWSVYPFFPSGNLIVSSVPKGLFVLQAELGNIKPPAPTPAPPPTPTQTTTAVPSGGCVHEKDCDKSPLCNDDGFDHFCEKWWEWGDCMTPICKRIP